MDGAKNRRRAVVSEAIISDAAAHQLKYGINVV